MASPLHDDGSDRPRELQVSSTPQPATHGFRIGDMVWGKVKSHPWWPGQIYHESFVSSAVRSTKIPGHSLVAFFGDGSYNWFDLSSDELLPFDLHFAEKSTQSRSGDFVLAVEEALDEAKRRGALAATCRCSSNCKFREADVKGFTTVEMAGFEDDGVYPSRYLREAKNGFVPDSALSSVLALAKAPHVKDLGSISWIKHKAMLLAYRAAVFADQSHLPASSQDAGPVPKRRSATQDGGKDASSKRKKTKLLLKRKEDETVTEVSKPPQPSRPLPKELESSPSLEKVTDRLADKKATLPEEEDLIAKKKNALRQLLARRKEVAMSKARQDPQNAGVAGNLSKLEPQDRRDARGLSETDSKTTSGEAAQGVHQRFVNGFGKKVVPKRHLDSDRATAHAPAKKMKMGKFCSSPDAVPRKDQEQIREHTQKSPPIVPDPSPMPPAVPDTTSSEQLPQLLSDLVALATDPFHGVGWNVPATVRGAFLKYRSRVFLQSLPEAPASKPEISEIHSPEAPASEADISKSCRDDSPVQIEPNSVPPKRPTPRPDDASPSTTTIGRKRERSDRLVEKSAKKTEKIARLKDLVATEKKASGVQQREKMEAHSEMGSASVPRKPQPSEHLLDPLTKKKKQESSAPKSSPTYLLVKFPPGAWLPSISELKAKMVRFGLLDVSSTFRCCRTNVCKVLFRYEPDAVAAFNYVKRHNNFFGPVQVNYLLEGAQQPSSPPSPSPSPSGRTFTDLRQLEPASVSSRPPPVQQQWQQPHKQQSHQPPKSCLKKPKDKAAATPIVKTVTWAAEPPAGLTDKSAKWAAESSAALTEKAVKWAGPNCAKPPHRQTQYLPTPPASPSHPLPVRPGDSRNLTFSPPLRPQPQRQYRTLPPVTPPPQPSQLQRQYPTRPLVTPPPQPSSTAPIALVAHGRNGHSAYNTGSETELDRNSSNDISNQFLSLLMTCNVIVTTFNCALGYAHYRPL